MESRGQTTESGGAKKAFIGRADARRWLDMQMTGTPAGEVSTRHLKHCRGRTGNTLL